MEDSQWLCKLLRNGLIRGSFIPPKDIRELRDLTRYKKRLVESIAVEKNRIEKVLEDANIKLSSVASDIFGVSGIEMIKAIIEGESSPEEMNKLAIRHINSFIGELDREIDKKLKKYKA